MGAPILLAADFARAFKTLLPRGRLWPRDDDTVIAAVFAGLSPSYERQTARSNQLLVDAFPSTAYELLPEWESSLGLPDPCTGLAPTTQQRQNNVVAHLTEDGGQSVAYFTGLAAKLGYTITITQFSPFTCNSRCTDPICGDDWAYAWQINAPTTTVFDSTCLSGCDEPLRSWGNTTLECEIEARAPAHTTVIFSYS